MYAIRRARLRELPQLCALEQLAGERFREVGLAHVADAEPRSVVELTGACEAGRLFVVDDGSEPVGFALVEWVDGLPHLAEISVAMDHGRRGLGRRLVEFVCAWARALGHDAVTLSTFRDVPWNGPFYRRLGFEALDPDSVGPGLARIREEEQAHGLDPASRDLMRRELADP